MELPLHRKSKQSGNNYKDDNGKETEYVKEKISKPHAI